MEKDELVVALRDLARKEEAERDPRWEALSQGTLSDEDRAALEDQARRSERAQARLEIFRPLPAEARARSVDRIMDVIHAGKQPAPAPRPKPGRRLPYAAIGAAAALALALAFLFLRPGATPDLPPYAIAVVCGGQPSRATDDPRNEDHLPPRARIEITLRPSTRIAGPVAVRAFLVKDGSARDWPVDATVLDTGAVTITGTREAVFGDLAPGRWQMVFAVGRRELLPSAASLPASGEKDGYRILRHEIVLDAPGE